MQSDEPLDAAHGRGLRARVAEFEVPSLAASWIQIATTVALFCGSCGAMYWSFHISYWLTLALAVPTAGLLVRVFIIQHDCGHGALFRSRKLNNLIGQFCSLITFAPYTHWQRQHAGHHGNWNNLDRRESGVDIYSACLTVGEYRALKPWDRFVYRIVRHPIVAHFLIPPAVFLILYRLPFDTPKNWVRERRSVHRTNLAIVAALAAESAFLGFHRVLLVQLPVVAMASIAGVWLFSLQHRFDGVVWARQSDWTPVKAAIEGSSYLRLPRLLQWFTGNIGFHHIHHLNPRIPNYRLEACHKAVPGLQRVTTLDWRGGFAATRLALWDEGAQRAVRFSEVPIVM